MRDRGYQQVDHTADLAISIWAPDLESLFEEGAFALVDIMTEGAARRDSTKGPDTREGPDARTLQIEALDLEDLLIQWLNEVIYLAVTEGFTVSHAELSLGANAPHNLEAKVQGSEQSQLKGELKSATYHGLELKKQDGAWRAFVVIDV